MSLTNKKPAIVANRGFLEIYGVWLEISSRDGRLDRSAMPHGRVSIGALAAQANVHIAFHLLTAGKKHYRANFVKWFFWCWRNPGHAYF
jgi:hypothetical protein